MSARAVAVTQPASTMIARLAFLRILSGQRPVARLSVFIWLDERIGELAPINVQFALSGSGIHDNGTPGMSYA
jgi:hypothetical protein